MYYKLVTSDETNARWEKVVSCSGSQATSSKMFSHAAKWSCIHECFNYLVTLSSEKYQAERNSVELSLRCVEATSEDISNNAVLSGTVRSVAGWVLYKCRLHCLKQCRLLAGKGGCGEVYRKAYDYLDSHSDSYAAIHESTAFPASLQHLERVNRGGLVIVDDNFFLFFCCVESVCQKLFTCENVHLFQANTPLVLQQLLLSNGSLIGKFHSLVTSDISSEWSSSQLLSQPPPLSSVLSSLPSSCQTSSPESSSQANSPTLVSSSPSDTSSDSSPLFQSKVDEFLFNLILERYLHMRQKEHVGRLAPSLQPVGKSVALRKELAAVSVGPTAPPSCRKRFFFTPTMVEKLKSDQLAGLAKDSATLSQRAAEFGCEVKQVRGWHQRHKNKL